MIPYSTQSISNQDIRAVTKILKSRLITQGKVVQIFEKTLAKKVGAKYAVSANSATSALHMACLALGLSKKDYLWTSSNSFVASANCGRFCGANIDFVDIDKDTWNISVDSLEKKLIKAKKIKKLPKIIVIVHFAGQPAEMEKIHKLKIKYGFKIIEDASHALGAKIGKKAIGNCFYSEISVFSFHPVKSMTTAEGGMALTNSLKLEEKLRLFGNHGITRDLKMMKKKLNKPWYYEQIKLGFNYRMNELQAALGLSQLKRLDLFIKKRNLIAKQYKKAFKNSNIQFQKIKKNYYSSYHLFVIKILEIDKFKYDRIFNLLREKKLGVNLHYLPIHKQPYYSKLKNYDNLTVSEDYAKTAFSIPIYYDLNKKKLNYAIKVIKTILAS
jgi:UDP-4-amino-4,6-dideoxy-N-acetyl-beta-L-altrosamine transaminase